MFTTSHDDLLVEVDMYFSKNFASHFHAMFRDRASTNQRLRPVTEVLRLIRCWFSYLSDSPPCSVLKLHQSIQAIMLGPGFDQEQITLFLDVGTALAHGFWPGMLCTS